MTDTPKTQKEAVLPPLDITAEDLLRVDEGYQDLGGSDVFFYTTKDKDDNGEQLYSLAQMFSCRERQLLEVIAERDEALTKLAALPVASEGEAKSILRRIDDCPWFHLYAPNMMRQQVGELLGSVPSQHPGDSK